MKRILIILFLIMFPSLALAGELELKPGRADYIYVFDIENHVRKEKNYKIIREIEKENIAEGEEMVKIQIVGQVEDFIKNHPNPPTKEEYEDIRSHMTDKFSYGISEIPYDLNDDKKDELFYFIYGDCGNQGYGCGCKLLGEIGSKWRYLSKSNMGYGPEDGELKCMDGLSYVLKSKTKGYHDLAMIYSRFDYMHPDNAEKDFDDFPKIIFKWDGQKYKAVYLQNIGKLVK